MSFIEVDLSRRPKPVQLGVEILESRECPAVTAPTGLAASAVSSSQVRLAWNDIAGESGYRVYRWDGATTTLLGQLAANTKAFTVNSLAANRMYWFTVEAFDASTTARAAWKSVTTPPDAITAPTNLRVAGVTQTQITLQWNFASGAQGYRVYGWDGTSSVLLGNVSNTVNAFVVSNLSPGSTYYFYVQAYNATNTASSDWLTAQTSTTAITAPTGLKANTVNASTIGLSWKDSVSETGYRVYRWDGNNANSPVLIATLAANVTGYQATGLLPGKTYWFYVQAFNVTTVANSTWAQATTVAALPLQAPGNVTAIADGSTSVRVSWVEPARAVGYRVYVWAGTGWALARTVAAGTNKVSIGGLHTNQTHWFMVQAYTDNNAEVSYSSAVFANL